MQHKTIRSYIPTIFLFYFLQPSKFVSADLFNDMKFVSADRFNDIKFVSTDLFNDLFWGL